MAVVVDEAELTKSVHEEADADRVVPIISASVSWLIGGYDRLRLSLRAEIRKDQEQAGETFFVRVEKLVDEIRFDANIARQQVRGEPLGELLIVMDQRMMVAFSMRSVTQSVIATTDAMRTGLSAQAPLAEKIVGREDRNHRLLALFGHDGDFDFALLDMEYRIRRVALRNENLVLTELDGGYPAAPPGSEEVRVMWKLVHVSPMYAPAYTSRVVTA